MVTYTYAKVVNDRLLTQELLAAGFLLPGITQHFRDPHELIITFDDAETKDPTAIVNAHVYKVDLQPDLVQAMNVIRADFLQAQDTLTTFHTQATAASNFAQMKAAVLTYLTPGLNQLGTCLKKTGRLLYFQANAIELDNTEYETGILNLDK